MNVLSVGKIWGKGEAPVGVGAECSSTRSKVSVGVGKVADKAGHNLFAEAIVHPSRDSQNRRLVAILERADVAIE